MTKHVLKSLTVQALRGATEPFSISFEKSKSLTLIYGENGTGKTTLCDALDFIGNGRVGSLDGRGLGVTANYWTSIGKSRTNVQVSLESSSGKWVAGFSGKSVKVLPDDGSMPQVSVLRRSQLLQLLQDTPANRYDAIRPFIDISAIEACEKELRGLIQEKERQLTTASAVIAENKATIEDAWIAAGSLGSSALAWARAECGKSAADFDERIAHLRSLSRALNDMGNGLDRIEQADTRTLASRQQVADAEAALVEAKAACLADEGATIQLLLEAQKYLTARGQVDTCPLCGSAENASELPMQIEQKLRAIQGLRQALSCRDTADSFLRQSETILANEQQTLSTAAERFAMAWAAMQDEARANVDEALRIAASAVAQAVLNGSDLAAGLKGADISEAIRLTQASLELLEGAKAQAATLKSAVERYETNYASLDGVSRVLPSLRKTLAVVEEERRAYVDRLLQAIAKEVGQLYEKLHPGEGLDKISLTLDPAKRASLELGAEFLAVKDAPPHAYFSESHLDSLGLCVFLALASLQGRERTILVLDDILGSIDEPHVDRLINLLYEESERFLHCVITTHYRPWKEKYRWGRLKTGQIQFVELKSWSHGSGIASGKTSLPPVAQLGKLLADDPPDAQLLCGSAGVLLEAVCDYLTAHYECAVPRRKGKPTLGDLLPAIDKKLKPVLKIERQQPDKSYVPIELGKIFDELQTMAQVRNIFGCHFNELAMYLPEQDAIAFAKLVHQAADALCCVDEGWPMTEKAGSYWATRNETRRLHPFKKPS